MRGAVPSTSSALCLDHLRRPVPGGGQHLPPDEGELRDGQQPGPGQDAGHHVPVDPRLERDPGRHLAQRGLSPKESQDHFDLRRGRLPLGCPEAQCLFHGAGEPPSL